MPSMKSSLPIVLKAVFPALALAVLAPAQAADHALIMGIGNYQNPADNLPGIDKDTAIARRMAESIGVPGANITVMMDHQLSDGGMRAALLGLERRIGKGDRVFLYYSGHGTQDNQGIAGNRCSEGMVTWDGQMLRDKDLEEALEQVAAKAGQLIMFNDSCFSGGAAAATKARGDSTPDMVPKFTELKSGANAPGYTCGDPVNKMGSRNLSEIAKAKGNNFIYIAASADNEVSFATSKGSSATLAWEMCLRNPAADTDRSGGLNAEELRACAQGVLTRSKFRQTVTLVGNNSLPISFAGAAAAPPPASNPVEAALRNAATLEDIRQSASSNLRVELSLARNDLRIGQDPLDFSVRTSSGGYLYVLHVGSDGKTFDLLFPNGTDQNNRVQAGTHGLPRASWKVTAAGPAGTAYLMAIVSETPRDFTKPLSNRGTFASGAASTSTQRNLIATASGVGGGGGGTGQFGASTVVAVQERN